MLCPGCASYLAEKNVYDCTIRCCMSCDGIWVEKETFTQLALILSFDQRLHEEKLKLFKPREVFRPDSKSGYRICPKCKVAMREFNYAYDSNIFLDRCSQCGGIWADAGEMVRVARHIKADPDAHIIARGIIERPYLKKFENDAKKLMGILETAVYAIGAFF